jgi:Na+-driven multidrug efflux pump
MKRQEASVIEGLGQSKEFLKRAYNAALIPSMLSILSGCVNIIADGIIVGQKIGTNGLTAISLCVPVYLVLCIIGSFFVSGTAICASNEIGKDNGAAAQRFYGIALFSCIVSSVVMTLVGIFLSGPIAGLLCSDGAVVGMVRDYTQITLIGAAPKILIYIPFWFLRLDGKHKTVTVMMTIMGVGNVLLDILFLFGMDMGVFGAALASVLATAIACEIGLVQMHTGKTSFRFKPERPDMKSFRRISMAGSPAALNNLMQTFRLLCVNGILMAYNGSGAVALFTVVNGISAFTEAVTVGVPQAASAILGVYQGEHDNRSIQIMLKLELTSGMTYCGIFAVAISAGAGLIGAAYGLDVPIYFPMICLALSLFPALCNSILSGFYNVSGYAWLSNLLIFCRVFLFSVSALFILAVAGGPVWLFLIIGEVLTLAAAWVVTGVISSRNKNLTRPLLLDTSLDRSDSIINFSVLGVNKEICGACEKVTEFLESNGMDLKQTMRISLAMEELMTLIGMKNAPEQIHFDLRMFSYQGTIGIRIRYDGIDLNPLSGQEDSDEYMGIAMIRKLVQNVMYKRILGLNSLLVII